MLSTPPAFNLSQNQTLQLKNGEIASSEEDTTQIRLNLFILPTRYSLFKEPKFPPLFFVAARRRYAPLRSRCQQPFESFFFKPLSERLKQSIFRERCVAPGVSPFVVAEAGSMRFGGHGQHLLRTFLHFIHFTAANRWCPMVVAVRAQRVLGGVLAVRKRKTLVVRDFRGAQVGGRLRGL